MRQHCRGTCFVSYPLKQTFSHYHHQLDSLEEILYIRLPVKCQFL